MPTTPLAPDDGENDNAPAPATGLRLSDAEQIAAQRLDGSADGSPTPAIPLPPVYDGETNSVSALPPGLRLSDAEQIAAQLLDGSADGSPTSAIPLPPVYDSETNSVSALRAGLRLSDAEQIAAQLLDSLADRSPPATMLPPPAHDGESDLASELPTNLRLSDAEQIAAQRLDGAAEGSLKEALAIAPAEDMANAAPSFVNGVEAVNEVLPPEPQAPPVDALLAAPLSHAQPAAECTPEPSSALPFEASVPALAVEAVEAPGPSFAEAPAQGVPSPEPIRDLQAPASDAPQVAAALVPLGVGAPEAVRPLTSALDAATKLAADANAAAEALESLKRLLERQLPNVAPGPPPPAPRAATEVWRTVVTEPARPPPLPLPPSPPRAAAEADAAPQPAPRLPVPVRRMPVERTRFDVRGFFAGFALSWAFGIVLYLFMTAG